MPLDGTLPSALSVFGRPDVIHDNGIWMPHNHELARVADRERIPRVVSLRGMLEPWAMNHKRRKKQFAWLLYQRRDLRRAAVHHVTSATELKSVHDFELGAPVELIPNGVDLPGMDELQRSNNPIRRAVFLGRIYPVKGLPLLIEAWSRVRPEGWQLEIAGPDEAGHAAVVRQAIGAAGLSSVISLKGPLDDRERTRFLAGADLFILPSHSESFGMAIAEAAAHALPVITTTGTPWRSLSECGAGWWVPPEAASLAAALQEAASMNPKELRDMGARARLLVTDQFSWNSIVDNFTGLYSRAASSVAVAGASPA